MVTYLFEILIENPSLTLILILGGGVLFAVSVSKVTWKMIESVKEKFSLESLNTLTGAEMTTFALERMGLKEIQIKIGMKDYYNSGEGDERYIGLTEGVNHHSNVQSVAVSLHEVGHAVQYNSFGNHFVQKLNHLRHNDKLETWCDRALIACVYFAAFTLLSNSWVMFSMTFICLAFHLIKQISILLHEADASKKALIMAHYFAKEGVIQVKRKDIINMIRYLFWCWMTYFVKTFYYIKESVTAHYRRVRWTCEQYRKQQELKY